MQKIYGHLNTSVLGHSNNSSMVTKCSNIRPFQLTIYYSHLMFEYKDIPKIIPWSPNISMQGHYSNKFNILNPCHSVMPNPRITGLCTTLWHCATPSISYNELFILFYRIWLAELYYLVSNLHSKQVVRWVTEIVFAKNYQSWRLCFQKSERIFDFCCGFLPNGSNFHMYILGGILTIQYNTKLLLTH